MRLGILLVKSWVSWLMTWADSIRWPTSRIKWFLTKINTKFTTVSLWTLLRPSKHGGIIWKVANIRSSFLPIITTFVVSWIQRTRVFARFGRPKSSAAIIFGSIIIKEKQMELQTPYLVFFSKMIKKKPTFKLKTLKFFIVCSPHWRMRQFQISTPRFRAFCLSTRSLSAEPTPCYSSGVSEIPSKPSSLMSDLIKPVLVIWGSGYKSCTRPTAKPQNWGNKRPTAIKKLIRFFIIRTYRLYLKPFERSWLAVTTTILWPAILASRRLANCWRQSTIS